jgi:hypothetical protein
VCRNFPRPLSILCHLSRHRGVRDFNFVVLSDFGTVSNLTAEVATFASAAAEMPAFAFIGGDFDHSNPQTLADKGRCSKVCTIRRQGYERLRSTHSLAFSDCSSMGRSRCRANNLDKNYADWDLTQQAFQEYTPTYPLPAVTPGIWQNFSYAQADFFCSTAAARETSGWIRKVPSKACSMEITSEPPASSNG